MQQKIQCPNCGATSGFIEKKPGFYRCNYCGSMFEHISIVPSITVDKQLFEQIEGLYNEYKALTPDRAKYHQRILTGVLQINGLMNGISDSEIQKNAFKLLEELLSREVAIYIKNGYDLSHFQVTNLSVLESDVLVKAMYLKQLYAVWAHNLSKIAANKNELIKALEVAETAQKFTLPIEVPIVVDLKRTKLGLLRRLNRDEEAFTYLDSELKGAADQEQFKYDFEDVFRSQAYVNFKKGTV